MIEKNSPLVLKDLNIFSNVTREDICYEPFPHIVINNFYDDDIYSFFAQALPPDDVVRNSKQILQEAQAGQLILRSQEVLKRDCLKYRDWEGVNIWRAFFKYYSSNSFWREIVRLFGPEIRERFIFKANIGEEYIDNLRRRHIRTMDCERFPYKPQYNSIDDFLGQQIELYDMDSDHHKRCLIDVDEKSYLEIQKPGILFDGRIGIYPPNKTLLNSDFLCPPHIDFLYGPVVCIMYFRDENDYDEGGDLCLYRQVGSKYSYGNKKRDEVEEVKTIKYDKNVAVIFVNSPESIHGVTKKEEATSTRRMVYLSPKLKGIDPYGRLRFDLKSKKDSRRLDYCTSETGYGYM